MALPAQFYAHAAGISYRPSGTPTPAQKVSVFLPTGKRPRDGWPVFIHTDFGAWLLSNQAAVWSRTGSGNTTGSGLQYDGLPYLLLASGTAAVVSAGFTALNQATAAGGVVAGHGTFKSPSVAEFATQDFAETDAMRLRQWVFSAATTYGFNPYICGGKGLSSGASALLYSQYAANQAGQSSFYTAGTTRLDFLIAHACQYLYRAIDPTNGSYFHFPQSADVAPYNTVALTIGAASPTFLDDASVMKFGFVDANLASLAKFQRIYMLNDVLPEYTGQPGPPPNPAFRTTADNLWNNCAGLTAYTGAVGVNGGVYAQNGYHQTHAALLFKETLMRNGAAFGPNGGLNKMVTSFLAAKKSTWDATDPGQDLIMQDTLDFSADGEMAQDQLAWVQAVIKGM